MQNSIEKFGVFFQSWPKTFVAFSHSTTFEKLQNQVIRKHIGSHENVGRKVYFYLVYLFVVIT